MIKLDSYSKMYERHGSAYYRVQYTRGPMSYIENVPVDVGRLDVHDALLEAIFKGGMWLGRVRSKGGVWLGRARSNGGSF